MGWDKEYEEYLAQLSPEEREYVKKFYAEYYRADFYGEEENIITDPVMKSEVIREKNSMQRNDALTIAEKLGKLDELSGTEEQFMDEASDHWEWNDVYKVLGYEAAVDCILNQALVNLENKTIDGKITLMRFWSKMNELYRVDKRSNRKREK